jgi:PAS domain S-box-containing protein
MREKNPFPAYRILIVDDEQEFHDFINHVFAGEPIGCISAFDGEQALEILCNAEQSDQQPIDLVLLDMMMPKLNGIETLRRIRADGIRANVPVLMVSVDGAVENKVQAFDIGADDYITKPFDYRELQARMQALLRARQTERDLIFQHSALNALNEIGQKLASVLDFESVLDLIAETVAQLVGARRSLILLLENGAKPRIFARGFGYTQEHLDSFTFEEFDAGLSGWVLRNNRPAITTDAQSDPRQTGIARRRARDFGSQSVIVAPVIIDGCIVGTLTAVNTEGDRALDENDLDLVAMLASQAAVAIKNARLFSALFETKKRLDGLIASSFDAVIAIDAANKITVFNERAQEMFGYGEEEMLGRSVAILHDDIAAAREIHDVVCNQGAIANHEITLIDKHRNVVPVLLSAKRLEDDQGNVIGQAGFMRDLRQVRLLEDRLHALILAVRAISQPLELEKVLRQVIMSALTAIPSADQGSIHLFDERTGRLELVVAEPSYPEVDFRDHGFGVGEGVAGWVYAANEAVLIKDTTQDSRYLRRDGPGFPPDQSLICVPLRGKDLVIGTISLGRRSVSGVFSADDLLLLSAFGGQAAVAIDHAQQFAAIQQEARDRELLRKISSKISVQVKIEEVLRAIVEGGTQLLGVEMAVAHLVDRFTGAIKESIAVPEEMADLMTPPRGEGLTSAIVKSRQHLLVEDTAEDERVNPTVVAVGIRSLVGFPLTVRGEAIGALFLNSTKKQFFGSRELTLTSLLVAQAANAIENAILFEKNQKRLDQLQNLADASRKMMKDLNLLPFDERLDLILQHCVEISEAEAGSILLVRRPSFLRLEACYGYRDDSLIGREFEIKSGEKTGLTGHIAYTGETFRAHGKRLLDHPAVAGEEPPQVASGTCHSLLVIPLKQREGEKEELVGLLRVENKIGETGRASSEVGFTEEDEWILNIFAEDIIVTLENAELFERTDERLAQRVRMLQALNNAGKAITGTLEVDEILRLILEQARTVTGITGSEAEFGFLALVEGDKLRFHMTDPAEELGKLQATIGDICLNVGGRIGVMGRVAETGRSILVPDVTGDSDYIEYLGPIRSALAVPVKLGNETIGVIDVEHTNLAAFDKDDRECLEALASYAAIAIENARRFKELRELKGLVGANLAVAWMGMASNAWRHTIEGHAITIRDEVNLLLSDLRGADIDGILRERLEKIDRKAVEILQRPITPPLSEEEGLEIVSLNHLLRERVDQLWQNEPFASVECSLDFHLSDEATVHTCPDWFIRVIDLLIENAVSAMAKAEEKRLKISTRPLNRGVNIRFADTGTGIPEEILPRLFRERIQESDGMGIGLLIAQVILQTYGGRISISETGPNGTTINVWLPAKVN